MRCVIGLALLAGCGRVDFEPVANTPLDAPISAGVAFRDLCRLERFTVIENGLAIDDTVGARTSAALVAGCNTTTMTRTVSQDDAGILDPATDRPLLAPTDLAVIGGGDGPHRAIAYLLAHDTPVIWSGGATATYRDRATGQTILVGPTSSTHDFALVMVVVEPIGGGHIVSLSGMQANGTLAAGEWFATMIAPQIATVGSMWTLVEWTNADGDPAPSAGDTYLVRASG